MDVEQGLPLRILYIINVHTMPHCSGIPCHYCGESSLWRKSAKVVHKETILECHHCNKHMCGTCSKGFQKVMDDTKFISKEFWNNDDIYRTILGVNTSLHGITIRKILPCCESWEDVRTYNDVEYSKIAQSAYPISQENCIQVKKKTKMSNIRDSYKTPIEGGTISLDGALLFPSYHILVPGYIGMPQTHVIGSQGDFYGEEGVPHAVVDSITAKHIDMVEFASHKKKHEIIRSTVDVLQLPNIHGVRTKKKVQWIELKLDRTSHLCVKKYCTPSQSQILHSTICYPQSLDIDILVILGEPLLDESEYYMLAGLFLRNHCLEHWDWRNSNELFDHMKKMLPKHGFETARTGGSLGLCLKNSDMRSFLYKKGIFPRHRTSCRFILVNTVSKCGVLCYYCTKKTKEYTCWFYHTPRVGGHVSISLQSTMQFPFFGLFPECRIQTAIIIMYFNTKAISLKRRCTRSRAALMFLQEIKDTQLKLSKDIVLGTYLSMAAEHSLVTHPVGYHLDAFSRHGSGDVIENKICLLNVQKSNCNSEYALGRGGCGPGKYVFAILDWGTGFTTKQSTIVCNIDVKDIENKWKGFLDTIPL